MRVLIQTIGSHGDVHPFIGLALALSQRGHEITFATNGYFRPLVERAGFTDFHELGSAEEYRELAKSPELWHRTQGFKFIFEMILKGMGEVYDVAAEFHRQHPDGVVVSSTLCLGARCAQDKLGFPMATVHLAPAIFRSLIDPPKMSGSVMPKWFPRFLKKGLWAFADRFVIAPIVCPGLNKFRAEKGLPPVKRPLMDWWHSPDLTMGLWPEWFAPKQIDWPAQSRLAGFPLWDERGLEPVSPELDHFLSAGDKPIAFTPGSAMWQGDDFFAAAVDACKHLGRRGLLLSRHHEHIPRDLPAEVMHVEFAPFSELLPRVAALVHHGGIGTTSQALQAGVPQLIMAMSHDQPDNAARVQRLGVGLPIKPTAFDGKTIAKKLKLLLDSPAVAQACAAVRQRFDGGDSFAMACQCVESLRRS